MLNVHRNSLRLIRDGETVGGMGRGAILWHHQNDSCIKMGSDERHSNASLTVRDKVTRQCPQTTTLSKGKESRSGIEPRSFCLPA